MDGMETNMEANRETNNVFTNRTSEPEESSIPGSWESYNSFMLRGSAQRFTKVLARYELFKRIIDLPGDIIEGGVFKGAGVLYWAKLIQIFNPLSERRVIGFDTFEGYPEDTRYHYEKEAAEEFLSDSTDNIVTPQDILAVAASHGLEQRIELVKGDATHTIKKYVKDNPGLRVALLNNDLDGYYPTAAALEHIYPLLVPGGVIAFDEYGERFWGESQAVDEFFKDKSVVYHSFPWAFSPTAYVVKEP